MKNTSTVKIAIGIFSGLMLWVCVFSYFSFAKYKPQIQDSEPKVKGAKTISVVNDLPTIPDSTVRSGPHESGVDTTAPRLQSPPDEKGLLVFVFDVSHLFIASHFRICSGMS
jgi:hypothetical protein